MVRTGELAAGTIPERCPDPSALSFRLPSPARSWAHWLSPPARLWVTVVLFVGHHQERVPVATLCLCVKCTVRHFVGAARQLGPVFRWGFGGCGPILFFIKNLQMGNLAPYFIDVEPAEGMNWCPWTSVPHQSSYSVVCLQFSTCKCRECSGSVVRKLVRKPHGRCRSPDGLRRVEGAQLSFFWMCLLGCVWCGALRKGRCSEHLTSLPFRSVVRPKGRLPLFS